MIALLLATLSWSIEPPWGDVHAGALVEAPELGAGGSIGGGISIGEAPYFLEARVDGALLASGSRLAIWPSFRAYLRDVDNPGLRPSLLAGLGPQLGKDAGGPALLMAALDLDLPSGEGWTRPRLGVWTEATLEGRVRFGIRLGVVHRSGKLSALRSNPTRFVVDKEEALADLVKDTPAESVSTPTSGQPGDRQGPYWDPETCQWVDEDPGHGWTPADGAGLGTAGLDVGGSGTAGAGSAGLEQGGGGGAAAAVRQGWLVVVAEPGAVVRLPGLEQTVTAEGAAKLRAPEGVVDVEVIGGGRTQTFEAAIADGYVLWLRADPPDEVAVQFASGSAEVDQPDRVAAQALARNRGQFRLRLTGSYSPEGNKAYNLDLARRRAEAVSRMLQEVGVPAEDIDVLDPTPPRAGLTAAEQRAVYIQPVPQGVTP